MSFFRMQGSFIDNLPKIYGFYTGGFVIFIGLMALLLLLIDLVGHYIGISVFMFVLMRWIAKEKLWLSIATAFLSRSSASIRT